MAVSAAVSGMSNRGGMLADMLKTAASWKPQDYNSEIAKRRDYYLGNQIKWLRGYLSRVYPQQAARMVPFVVGLFRFVADNKATIYSANPTRAILVDGNADAEATGQVDDLYIKSSVNAKMKIAEAWAAACDLCFVRVGTDPFDDKIVLSPRWPDTVHVIPHPDWPTSLPKAHALIAETTSEAGVSPRAGERRYEVWQRFDEQWQYSVMRADGASMLPEEFDGQTVFDHLPWLAVRFDGVEETLYSMPSADDIDVQDAINALVSDLLWGIKQSSWPQLTYSGPKPEQALVGGPGVVWDGGEAGIFNVLNFQPPVTEVREVMRELISRYLVLHNLPPTVASTQPDYQSGVALRVKNQPRDEARLSRVPFYRELEQNELWPIMRSQSEGLGMSWPADAQLAWYQGELVLPVDDVQEWQLAESHVEAGVTTWPEEMVRLRLAPNLEAAMAKFEAIKQEKAKRAEEMGLPQQPPPQQQEEDGEQVESGADSPEEPAES